MIELLYEKIFSVIPNHGTALIILSIILSFINTLIANYFFRISSKENYRIQKINSEIAELKKSISRERKKDEVQRIKNKYSYKEIYELSSLFPLFAQLPILIATYLFLIDYQPIEGVALGPIKDLSLPDNMLFGLNILPILMTLFNILSFGRITQENSYNFFKSSSISILFLVLLYKMPSSLLIYWTINNLFLFIRTLSKTSISFSFNKRFLDEKFLFIYLIPLLDVIHYWSKDTSSFVFLDFFYFLAIIIGVIFISLRILKKVTKEYERLGFFVAISVLFFLNISAYHSNLSEILFNRKLALIVLVLIYLSVSLIPYFFYNLMTNLPSSKLNVFFLSLILIYLVSGSLNADKNFKYDNSISPKIEKQLDAINQEEKDGDIILIVLDAYGSEQTLKSYYEHDNSNFTKKLDSFGFTTVSQSFSNYSQTHLSLASMLNFTYLNNYEGIPKKGKSGKFTQKLLSDNKVGKILKKLGYNYIHFNSGWGGNISSENADNNIDTYLKTIPISRNFNTYLLKSFIPKIYEFTISKSEAEMEKLRLLENIAMNKTKDFVFMHMMLPHPPYVFNEEGEVEVFENSEHFGGVWLDKDAYINQLKFLNKKLIELINKILNKSDIKPAFIIVSDHGPYITNPFETNNIQQDLIKNRMQNFTSIFLPNLDKTKSDLNLESTSLINIFPIFFREYFGVNFKLSEDKLFYSSYLEPYQFSEVKN